MPRAAKPESMVVFCSFVKMLFFRRPASRCRALRRAGAQAWRFEWVWMTTMRGGDPLVCAVAPAHHARGLPVRRGGFRNERNESAGESRLLRPMRSMDAHMGASRAKINRNLCAVQNHAGLAAAAASSASFSTVFQLRAVLGTPMPLSNFTASLEVPKPFGVWM